jgi:hypothetical protein
MPTQSQHEIIVSPLQISCITQLGASLLWRSQKLIFGGSRCGQGRLVWDTMMIIPSENRDSFHMKRIQLIRY